MPDRDEHYVKYRVFYEPDDEHMSNKLGHPVPMRAEFMVEEPYQGMETWADTSEVEGLFFVLRPENDNYARIAMAAYAYACRQDYPHLAVDIIQMIEGLEWEEATGQNRDDIPTSEEDYLNPETGRLGDNVVTYIRRKFSDVK